jgi:hypothetical protein
MSEVTIIEVDETLHALTDMKAGTRMVKIVAPTDRPVTVHAVVNAKMLQKVRLFDAKGHMHFEWQGRGSGRTLGCGSRTFEQMPLLLGCLSYQDEQWIVNDLNVRSEVEDGGCKVTVQCEDGGDFPGDWDDLVVTLSWSDTQITSVDGRA